MPADFLQDLIGEGKNLLPLGALVNDAVKLLLEQGGGLFDVIGARTWRLGDEPRQANIVKIIGNFVIASAIQALCPPKFKARRPAAPARESPSCPATGTSRAAYTPNLN